MCDTRWALELKLHAFELPLKRPFVTSQVVRRTQKTLVVELRDGDVAGYGEATVNEYYGSTIENMSAAVETLRNDLQAHTFTTPDDFHEVLRIGTWPSAFARCAVDEAAHDLWGKVQGKPLRDLWGLESSRAALSSYTIGLDTIDAMLEKLDEAPGWPAYKIKLGRQDDVDIVRAIRARAKAALRVDANGGWSVDETIEKSRALADLGVEMIEQPLPPTDLDGMKRVFAESAVSLFADESCCTLADIEHCQDRFHGINIKLTKCGGLSAARAMITSARRHGLRVMIGCMVESTVGISAAAQLLPLVDAADLDGANLLAQDIATGARIERGVCRYSDRPGTGAELLT